jgi:hypothetical protein
MSITAEQVTFIAAVIAAFASVITLVMNIFAARSSEMRVAHRRSLEQHIHDLSDAIHSTVATTKILTQAKTEPAVENWRERADCAQNKLKELRVILRYPLWGITDAMNTLTRLPDWIENARRFPKYSELIFSKGKKLGDEIDKAIRNSYTFGRPPNFIERKSVKTAEKRLEKAYENMKNDDSLTVKD